MEVLNGLSVQLQIIEQIERNQTAMSAEFDKLKTEVESFIADVQTDVATLGDKVTALQAAVDSGASATDIAGLTAEVTAAHAKLSGTVAAPPTVPAVAPTA